MLSFLLGYKPTFGIKRDYDISDYPHVAALLAKSHEFDCPEYSEYNEGERYKNVSSTVEGRQKEIFKGAYYWQWYGSRGGGDRIDCYLGKTFIFSAENELLGILITKTNILGLTSTRKKVPADSINIPAELSRLDWAEASYGIEPLYLEPSKHEPKNMNFLDRMLTAIATFGLKPSQAQIEQTQEPKVEESPYHVPYGTKMVPSDRARELREARQARRDETGIEL